MHRLRVLGNSLTISKRTINKRHVILSSTQKRNPTIKLYVQQGRHITSWLFKKKTGVNAYQVFNIIVIDVL